MSFRLQNGNVHRIDKLSIFQKKIMKNPFKTMKKKFLASVVLLFMVLTGCKSFQNEGGMDWATAEFSVDDSKKSIAHYSASESSIETALIVAVPEHITSVSISSYLTDLFDRQLQDLTTNTVSLTIPLNTAMRLAKVVFKETLTLDHIVNNQPTAFSTGISDVFSMNGSEESKTVTIIMDGSFSSKAITSFSFKAENNTALSADIDGIISDTDISLTVPFGTDITALVASFTTSGHSVSLGTTVQVADSTANDFSEPGVYTVTAADGTTQDYTVTVTVTVALSDTKTITVFKFEAANNSSLSSDVTGTIDEANHAISVTIPFLVESGSLIATYSTTGTSVGVDSTSQISGSTANDFTNPVTYTVTAADDST